MEAASWPAILRLGTGSGVPEPGLAACRARRGSSLDSEELLWRLVLVVLASPAYASGATQHPAINLFQLQLVREGSIVCS